jgi:hypothetical protein
VAFILTQDYPDEDAADKFYRYQEYLKSKRDSFPPSAYALATSDWYFRFSDHRCPHDAWLEAANLCESSSGKRGEFRKLSLTIRLLGAYHDGIIELYYPRLFSYALNARDGEHGQRDWLHDEFRVSDTGTLIHEIEWAGLNETGRWLIEASDIEFRWLPMSVT